jgi:hypothetical protein
MASGPPALCIRDSGTARGRGVFAGRAFRAGELVEASPVVVLDAPFDALPPALRRMVFAWPGSSRHALALGYGSLYNGANPANLRFERDTVHGAIRFFAVRDIAVGEELTINYSAPDGREASPHDDWFVDHGIRPDFGSAR